MILTADELEARTPHDNRDFGRQAGAEDSALRNDVRRLGQILGDTVREQEGEPVFELVERIRQTSVRFHRTEDEAARRELNTILTGMPTSDTVRIVRAFSYFSHLACSAPCGIGAHS